MENEIQLQKVTSPNTGVIEAIDRNRIDYNELARAIISASQQGAK